MEKLKIIEISIDSEEVIYRILQSHGLNTSTKLTYNRPRGYIKLFA